MLPTLTKNIPIVDIQKKLDAIEDLPSIDSNLLELVKKTAGKNPDEIDIDEVIAIIEKDIGLSAKVFQIANSLYYSGRYARFSSLRQALVRMGIPELVKVCTSIAAMQQFHALSNNIDLTAFWRHSIGVARALKQVGGYAQKVDVDLEKGYIAGLFHDIGSLVLDNYFGPLYTEVVRMATQQREYMYSVEYELLGMDHGEISAYLLQRWGLDEEIVAATRNHHHPERSSMQHQGATQLLHITDFASSALGAFEPGDVQPQQCDIAAWDQLGIAEDAMDNIIEETQQQIDVSGTFVSMVLQSR